MNRALVIEQEGNQYDIGAEEKICKGKKGK